MPNVLLIQPPIRDFYLTRKRTVPYGLSSIASELLRQGISVDILDALATGKTRTIPLPSSMDHLKTYYGRRDLSPFGLFSDFKHFGYVYSHIGQKAKNIRPDIIGVSSLFSSYSDEALQLAREIKKYLPQTPIIFGGHHPTAFPEHVISKPFVDYILRGEGEVSMPLLVKELLRGNKEQLKHIPGVVYHHSNGTLHISDPVIMKDLNDYPPPSFHLTNQRYYRRGKKDTVTITASRGCPMACSYCSVGGAGYLKYRRKTPETIIKEIQSYGPKERIGLIDFEDEHLSRDREWFIDLLKRIKRYFKGSDPIELRAMNGLFPPSLDESLIALMASAGFKTLNLSIGSTDPSQVKRFSRPDVIKAAEASLEMAARNQMNAVGYVIAGAPFQNADSSIDDLIWFAGQRVLAGVSIYYPAPLSQDFEKLKPLNLLPEDFALMRNTALPVSHTTTRHESVTLLRLGRILNFMKTLIDNGHELPEAASAKNAVDIRQSRHSIGRQLLSFFLKDARIRGIRPDGSLYQHTISAELSKQFLEKLKEKRIRGCITDRSVSGFFKKS